VESPQQPDWARGQIIAEYEAWRLNALIWKTSYIYLGGRLPATTDTGGTKYHHPDRLGTRLITDGATGAVLTEQANLPFGTALTGESSGEISNRRFTSYDRSARTGMDYAVNRFYSAAQGRFTQVDPIGMRAVSLSDPQSLNLYSYVQNDPVNFVDPTGRYIIPVTICGPKFDGEMTRIVCETVYYITGGGPVALPFGGIGDGGIGGGGGPAAGAQQSQQTPCPPDPKALAELRSFHLPSKNC
jgi:RHS repeat-associated protein